MIVRSFSYKRIFGFSALFIFLSATGSMSAGKEALGGDIFGKESGYFHPALSISESYNDNIYNTKDKEEDYITNISPSFWVALPGTKDPISIKEVSSGTTGGLTKTRFKSDSANRYQSYAFYGPQFDIYSQNDENNTTSHLAEGGLQVNLKGGMSFDVVDQYFKSNDPRGEGVSTDLDEFENNLLDGMIDYDITKKLQARIGGSLYNVHYSDTRNNYKDRQDQGLSAYLFFHLMPKTSIYVGYDHIDVEYDKDVINGFSDSTLAKYFAGVKWDITAKSKGNFKAGYLSREFDDKNYDDTDGFLAELTIDHNFTNSTSVSLTGARSNTQSDILGSNSIDSSSLGLTYNQKITAKIIATLMLRWENLDYQDINRTDDVYMISPKMQYKFTDWLTSDLVYTYKTRQSESDPNTDYDYENNTFMLRLTAAI